MDIACFLDLEVPFNGYRLLGEPEKEKSNPGDAEMEKRVDRLWMMPFFVS